MYDFIKKKRDGVELSDTEIQSFVEGVVSGEIPDYQISSFLMAVYFRGLTERETACLTMNMAGCGDQVDLSGIPGLKVDKHSTGGVGDKTTLIIGPIAAACGVKIAKMSGRGLGHTGGTVDKLESIPGFKTSVSREDFIRIVNETGIAVIGQSWNLCPADKKLYALRDVTATVESIPLIASSIMSKKIAAGADRVLLDVKVGDGAFMKTREDAEALAGEMVSIGKNAARKTAAVLTDMQCPLGRCIGNAVEIAEVCKVLTGDGPRELSELCLTLASYMIYLGEKAGDVPEARKLAEDALKSGRAFEKLADMVRAQGGDEKVIRDTSLLPLSPHRRTVLSTHDGYISEIRAEPVGVTAARLGAGRETKDSEINFGAGIILQRGLGDPVKKGDPLAELFTENEAALDDAEAMLLSAYSFSEAAPEKRPIIISKIGI